MLEWLKTSIVGLLALGALSSILAVSILRLTTLLIRRFLKPASLAVLPFINASTEPNTEYLSDGITESIINSLSQLPKLRVVSRATVFRYKGLAVDPQQAGQQLGVRAVLTGRVSQVGDSLTIGAELIDVSSDRHLWGEHYNRKIAGIFDVQEEIAQEISEKLRLKLSGKQKKQLAKRHTVNPDAYQLYLKGRYFWNKRTKDGLEKGIEYFKRSVEQDPSYALAYTGLADCYHLLSSFGVLSPKESVPKAKAAVMMALEMDATLAESHASLARIKTYYEWDWAGAESGFKRAIELNLNYATAHHWYSSYLVLMGRFDEGIAEAKRALELDPLSLAISTGLAARFYFARQYDQAIQQYKTTLELDRDFFGAHIIGAPYEQKGMYEEAIAEFQIATRLSENDPEVLACLGHAYALSGKRDKAQDVLDELKELSKRRYVQSYDLAVVYVGLGEKDRALKLLGKAYEERDETLVLIKVDPRLDPLRSDPRYAELLRRMGFP